MGGWWGGGAWESFLEASKFTQKLKLSTGITFRGWFLFNFLGLFGMIVLGTLMFPMYFIRVPATFSKDPEHRWANMLISSLNWHFFCHFSSVNLPHCKAGGRFPCVPTNGPTTRHHGRARPYYCQVGIGHQIHFLLYFYFFNLVLFFSIAFFNFAGVTVTKRLSATTRMVGALWRFFQNII